MQPVEPRQHLHLKDTERALIIVKDEMFCHSPYHSPNPSLGERGLLPLLTSRHTLPRELCPLYARRLSAARCTAAITQSTGFSLGRWQPPLSFPHRCVGLVDEVAAENPAAIIHDSAAGWHRTSFGQCER